MVLFSLTGSLVGGGGAIFIDNQYSQKNIIIRLKSNNYQNYF